MVNLAPRSANFGGALRLLQLLRKTQPDVLQTWLYHSDLVGLIFGRLAGVKKIVWNIRCANTAEIYNKGRNGFVLRLLKSLSDKPTAVIANSFSGVEHHTKIGYQPKNWYVIPNGFDTTQFIPNPPAHDQLCESLSIHNKSLLVGLVARFDPLKDHDTFLKSAQICAKSLPDVHFVLVGKGLDSSNTKITEIIKKLHLEDRTHLLGEQMDLAGITSSLDLATCSSIGEGFPNVVGEAMACGVPVVATDVGDTSRLVGDAGLVVAAANPELFANAMIKILTQPRETRSALGALGRTIIERDYSIKRITQKYADAYRQLA